MPKEKSYVGLTLLILAYSLAHYVVQYIPNPVVPNANIAINMIFPILAGYFYGPFSGAVAGALGTGLSALIYADMYDALAILPHVVMGIIAGYAGNYHLHFMAALSVVAGHLLNVLFFLRLDQLVIQSPYTLILGLVTETTVDVVAVVLVIVLFQKRLYREREQRW